MVTLYQFVREHECGPVKPGALVQLHLFDGLM